MVAQWVWHRNWCNCKPNQQDSLEYSFLVKWAPWYNSLQNSTSTSSGEQWAYAAEDEGQGLKILLCLVTASWKPAESRCEVAAQPLPFHAWKCSSISKLAATGLLSQCLVVTAWTQANITFCWTQGRMCFKQTQLLVHSSDAQGSCVPKHSCAMAQELRGTDNPLLRSPIFTRVLGSLSFHQVSKTSASLLLCNPSKWDVGHVQILYTCFITLLVMVTFTGTVNKVSK